MKKRIFALVMVVAFLLSAAACTYPYKSPATPSIVISKKADFQMRISETQGNVFLIRDGEEQTAKDQTLKPDDVVVCREDSRCTLYIGEKDYFVLDGGTKITFERTNITEVDAEPHELYLTKFSLESGRIFCAVTESAMNWGISITVQNKSTVFYSSFQGCFGIDTVDIPVGVARAYNFTAPMLMGSPVTDDNMMRSCSPGKVLWLNEGIVPLTLDTDENELPSFFTELKKDMPMTSLLPYNPSSED